MESISNQYANRLERIAIEYFTNGRTLVSLIHATALAILTELAVVFTSPFTEEIFFRGLVLSKFLEYHWLIIANILQSLLFTAVHWPNWIWTQGLTSNLIILSISIFVLGLLLDRLPSVPIPSGQRLAYIF